MELNRIKFGKGKQRSFIEKAWKSSQSSYYKFCENLGLPGDTLQSYRYEKSRLPQPVFENLCRALETKPADVLAEYGAERQKWIPEEALVERAKKGFIGRNKNILQDATITFTNENVSLDTSAVEYSESDKTKNIKVPAKITPLLAEEMGIHLGDGFLSNKRYDFRVKGDKKDEREYYDKVIRPMYKELFNVDLRIKEYESTYGFELSSKAIWQFKTKVLGIAAGPKTNIRIPAIFKVADKEILCSLVRGYFDTDGCVAFESKYGYRSYYPVISATSRSEKLSRDFNEILAMLGFKSIIYKGKDGYSNLHMYGYANLKRYSEIIGWHSPKHLKKVEEWKNKYPKLSMAGVV